MPIFNSSECKNVQSFIYHIQFKLSVLLSESFKRYLDRNNCSHGLREKTKDNK